MRKVMMLAAMLAMMLVAAAPAFAQDATVEGDDNSNSGTQYEDSFNTEAFCNQVQISLGDNAQYAAAAADDEAVAEVAQDLDASQQQVLNCFSDGAAGATGGGVAVADVDDDGDGTVDEEDGTEEAAAAEASASASAEASSGGELPDTGGASLFTLGAGALLVAGGLIARRIVR